MAWLTTVVAVEQPGLKPGDPSNVPQPLVPSVRQIALPVALAWNPDCADGAATAAETGPRLPRGGEVSVALFCRRTRGIGPSGAPFHEHDAMLASAAPHYAGLK